MPFLSPTCRAYVWDKHMVLSPLPVRGPQASVLPTIPINPEPCLLGSVGETARGVGVNRSHITNYSQTRTAQSPDCWDLPAKGGSEPIAALGSPKLKVMFQGSQWGTPSFP